MKKLLLSLIILSVFGFSSSLQGAQIILDDTDLGWTWSSGFALDPQPAIAWGDAQHVAEFSGATAEFSFTGSAIDFYGEVWSGGPSLEIFIDNVSKGIFTQDIPTHTYAYKFASITGLAEEIHAVKVVTIGEWGAIDYVEYTKLSTGEINTVSNDAKLNAIYNAGSKEILINSNSIAAVTVYNVAGQVVPTTFINNKISVSGLKKGVYVLKATEMSGNKVGSQKLVIY